jgi:membrane-bound lytic murein transglycosylase D
MTIHSRRNSNRLRRWLVPATSLITATIGMLSIAACDEKQPVPPPAVTQGQVTAPPLPAAAAAQQPATPAPAAPLTPQQRRTQQLIVQVEKTFQSGQMHYRKGQLVEAKADFDYAVDLMLAGGPNHDLDIKSDPQLEDEFERILDAVNALEMQALKQGNGFSPAIEPSPADVANDVTFESDPNLVAKATAELSTTKSDIPLVINDYVATYINFFANTQKGHNTLKHSLERSGKYKALIQRVMTEEGVPQDLIYLAVAESGFQPRAVNAGSGAGGMWQFMPNDKYYGLTRNGYVDERFDPEKSTRASARYMKFIYNQLGDWYLAMAGYNWGTGRVQQAVQKTGYADFWELYKRNNLPEQTKNYVPEIIAAIIIAKNPSQYGFDDLQFDAAITYDTIPINYSVDLRLVADIVDADPQELAALNPSLMRLTTPPSSLLTQPFDLHVPVGSATLFEQRIAEIPEDHRNSWRYHRVSENDSLSTIAHTYHVSVEQLATANQLHTGDTLDNIDALVIPVALPSAPVAHVEVYKARRGDSLVTIADRFGVSIEDLRRWNHLTGASVSAGQRVRVAEPAHVATHARSQGSTHGKSNAKPDAKSKSKAAQGGATQKQGSTAAAKKSGSSKAGKANSKPSTSSASTKKSTSASSKTSDAKKSKSHTKSTANKN